MGLRSGFRKTKIRASIKALQDEQERIQNPKHKKKTDRTKWPILLDKWMPEEEKGQKLNNPLDFHLLFRGSGKNYALPDDMLGDARCWMYYTPKLEIANGFEIPADPVPVLPTDVAEINNEANVDEILAAGIAAAFAAEEGGDGSALAGEGNKNATEEGAELLPPDVGFVRLVVEALIYILANTVTNPDNEMRRHQEAERELNKFFLTHVDKYMPGQNTPLWNDIVSKADGE